MLSRPVPFILLALGCLTAAGGGAYLATRHNAADPAVAATMPATVPEAVSRPATETATPQAVSETEAAVTPEKADQPAAEAPATVANAERPVRARQRRAEPKPAPSRRADPPAKAGRPNHPDDERPTGRGSRAACRAAAGGAGRGRAGQGGAAAATSAGVRGSDRPGICRDRAPARDVDLQRTGAGRGSGRGARLARRHGRRPRRHSGRDAGTRERHDGRTRWETQGAGAPRDPLSHARARRRQPDADAYRADLPGG